MIEFKFGNYLKINLTLLTIINLIYVFAQSQRICELQGTCFRCEHDRYSFYTCHKSDDCFENEYCNLQQFCCPIKLFSSQIEESATNNVYQENKKIKYQTLKWPDNSEWLRMCKNDADCIFQDEICVEGKCCPSNEINLQSSVLHQKQLNLTLSQNNNNNNIINKQYSNETCVDPMREFHVCGSSCPVTCATRNYLRCTHEKCISGCFCRLPYIVLDSTNLFESKCVLPAQCPLLSTNNENNWNKEMFYAQANLTKVNFSSLVDFASDSFEELNTPEYQTKKCADPLKNYLTCGSACPAGCNDLNPECTIQCNTGCFCRAPYVLKNSENLDSPCVPPYHCLNFHAITSCNLKPNRIWTSCASKSRCYRSCERLTALQFSADLFVAQQLDAACAVSEDCQAGCECRAPFIWQSLNDLDSECVLPADCPSINQNLNGLLNKTNLSQINETNKLKNLSKQELLLIKLNQQTTTTVSTFTVFNKCDSIKNKEFRNCASSCPLGCDNLELRLCTPCVSGCFCKNGYVFQNSSNWKQSECVLISDCNNLITKQTSSQQKDEHITIENNISTFNETKVIASIISILECPLNPSDINGRSCVNDFECGYQQKCCTHKINIKDKIISENVQLKNNIFNKCTCIDLNAVWMECGTVCPDFCYKDEIKDSFRLQDCPRICHAGCFCNNGFIKKTRDLTSPCIPILDCPAFFQSNTTIPLFIDEQKNNFSKITDKSLEKNNTELPLEYATKTTVASITSTNNIFYEAVKKNQFESNIIDSDRLACDEALTSAILFTINGVQIGSFVVRPDRRPIKHQAYENRLIRIEGKLDLTEAKLDNSLYYLSIHQFSDTTFNGCKSVGDSLQLQIVDKGIDDFTTLTMTKNICIKSNIQFDSTYKATPIDIIILWPDIIKRGINPLIGHSIVLKKLKNNVSTQRIHCDTINFMRNSFASQQNQLDNNLFNEMPAACAVFGIVPAC